MSSLVAGPEPLAGEENEADGSPLAVRGHVNCVGIGNGVVLQTPASRFDAIRTDLRPPWRWHGDTGRDAEISVQRRAYVGNVLKVQDQLAFSGNSEGGVLPIALLGDGSVCKRLQALGSSYARRQSICLDDNSSSSGSNTPCSSLNTSDEIGSVDTRMSDDEPVVLSLTRCIAAGVSLYKTLNKTASPEILALQEKCDRYLQAVEDDHPSSWVIKPDEFSCRFRCPYVVFQPGKHINCLLANAKNVDGVRIHIKTYHPDIYIQTLPCHTWNEIFDVCFPNAKPDSYPSPYFNIQLVREKYQDFLRRELEADRPDCPPTVTKDSPEHVPPNINIFRENAQFPDFGSRGYKTSNTQDVAELFSSFQALLHVRVSFIEPGSYRQFVDGYAFGNGTVNQGSYQINTSYYPSNQTRATGEGGGRRGLGRYGNEEDDYQEDEGSERTGNNRRDHDQEPIRGWRFGCPLRQIGHPELPCTRRFGGNEKLSHVRQHLKTRHGDVFQQLTLNSIKFPETNNWEGIFLVLFPEWPLQSLPIPKPWFHEPTLYETLDSSPNRTDKLDKLHAALLPFIQTRNSNVGVQAGPRRYGGNRLNQDTPAINAVSPDVSNPAPENVQGPDSMNPALHNNQLVPDHDQRITNFQYNSVNSHPGFFQGQQQPDLEALDQTWALGTTGPATYPNPAVHFYQEQMQFQPNQGYHSPDAGNNPHGTIPDPGLPLELSQLLGPFNSRVVSLNDLQLLLGRRDVWFYVIPSYPPDN